MTEHDELADQLEEANAYLSRIAAATEQVRTVVVIAAWVAGGLLVLSVLGFVISIVVVTASGGSG